LMASTTWWTRASLSKRCAVIMLYNMLCSTCCCCISTCSIHATPAGGQLEDWGMYSFIVSLISYAGATDCPLFNLCLSSHMTMLQACHNTTITLMPAGVQPQERHGQPGGGAHQPGQRTAEGGARRTHRAREVLQAIHRYVEGFHVGAAVEFYGDKIPSPRGTGPGQCYRLYTYTLTGPPPVCTPLACVQSNAESAVSESALDINTITDRSYVNMLRKHAWCFACRFLELRRGGQQERNAADVSA
jgi:hypothetical protein